MIRVLRKLDRDLRTKPYFAGFLLLALTFIGVDVWLAFDWEIWVGGTHIHHFVFGIGLLFVSVLLSGLAWRHRHRRMVRSQFIPVILAFLLIGFFLIVDELPYVLFFLANGGAMP